MSRFPINIERRFRLRSLVLVLLLHAGFAALVIGRGHPFSIPVEPDVEPLVRASLAHPPVAAETASAAIVEIEPRSDTVRTAVESMMRSRSDEPKPDAMAELARKAAILEKISTPKEVSRMSEQIREVVGVRFEEIATGDQQRKVDFDNCVMSTARRVEKPNAVEIHEVFVTPGGGSATMITARITEGGKTRFEQTIIDGGKRTEPMRSSAEEFEAAIARQRPFEIINKFPLVSQIHREAVLPIMEKMMGQETTSRPATTQPAPKPRPRPERKRATE